MAGSALAAFAQSPCDSRTACISVVEGFTDPHQNAVACRALGTPVILVCLHDEMQWWETRTTSTAVRETVPADRLDAFFEQHRSEFAPDTIYRAKTLGRFDANYQLEFVDIGLMPLIEAEAGRKMVDLLVRAVHQCRENLGWDEVSQANGHWLLKANFWLLAAKILRDKEVGAFPDLELTDMDAVYRHLASHYGADAPVPVSSRAKREALRRSAREIGRFSHLGLVSTESLAYLYEETLITKETRAELGTHSTPAYLVDYIIGKLRPWIEETPWRRHYVFEPACGHAAFMLAAMRLLGELLPANMSTPAGRRRYLRQRLHGCDHDPFALEIARLSLTLADVPNPNGWDLRTANMFEGDMLAEAARQASLVLANPPFEDFGRAEKQALTDHGNTPDLSNKSAEMLWQVATNMQPGAVLGVVLPQGVLHSKDAVQLRRLLATDFEIKEICLFADKVFKFSDAESAVIMARRRRGATRSAAHSVVYRRIRESGVEQFRRTFEASSNALVMQADLLVNDESSFRVPELLDLWQFCREYPQLISLADVGQGLFFRSRSSSTFPKGAVTESPHRKQGLVPGFTKLRQTQRTDRLPQSTWINLDPSVVDRPVRGATVGIPQLLLNYAPVSRGPWRLKALLDRNGHAVTSRFLVVRASAKRWPLELLWAILNSPLANAYSYAFSGKRDILAGLTRKMPVPRLSGVDFQQLTRSVQRYFKVAGQVAEEPGAAADLEKLRELHWRIDAEVLRLYQLPVELEHQLLLLFSGEARRGVPFTQTEYLPKGFEDPISLRDLIAISYDWEKTNERRTQLILDEERRGLGKRRQAELDHLQHLTDMRIRLAAPLPLDDLESFATKLKRRGLWIGDEA